MSESKTIARPYARAVFNIAKNKNMFNEWDNALSHLSSITQDRNAIDFIKNKTIDHENKASVIIDLLNKKNVFNDDIKELCNNFIKVVSYYGGLLYIKEIRELYIKHVDFELNRIKAIIEIAYPVNNEQKEQFINYLSKKFNKKVFAIFIVNEVLLGGFLVKIDDTVLDASVIGNLISLRNKIMI